MNTYIPELRRADRRPSEPKEDLFSDLENAMDPSQILLDEPEQLESGSQSMYVQTYEKEFLYGKAELVMRVERHVEFLDQLQLCEEKWSYSFTLPNSDSDTPTQELLLHVDCAYRGGQAEGTIKTTIERIGGRDNKYAQLPPGLGVTVYEVLLETVLSKIAAQYPTEMIHEVIEMPSISSSKKPLSHAEWMAIFEPLLRPRGYSLDVEGYSMDGETGEFEENTTWSKAYVGRNRGIRDFDEILFDEAA